MNQELLQAALASVNALVKDEIESGFDGRYHRAQQMCQIAQRLAAMGVGGNRVADALAMEGEDYMGDDIGGGIGALRPAQMRRLGAIPQQMGLTDVLREALAQVQEQNRANRVPRPERLLADLLDVRERLGRTDGCIPLALQQRIDRLVAEIGRDEPTLDDPPPMVDVGPPIGGPEDMP